MGQRQQWRPVDGAEHLQRARGVVIEGGGVGKRLTVDGEFATAARYCHSHSIPWSHWLGGPNEWDDESRDLVRAIEADDAARCPSCGTHHDDWFDGDRELRNHEAPLEVTAVVCPGCERIEERQATQDGRTHRQKGLRYAFRRRMHPDSGSGRAAP